MMERMDISSVKIRNCIQSDYEIIITVMLNWWSGRDLRSNVQRIFFDHFRDTVFVAEQNGDFKARGLQFADTAPEEVLSEVLGKVKSLLKS